MLAAEAGAPRPRTAERLRHAWNDPALRQAIACVLGLRLALGVAGVVIALVAPGDAHTAALPRELLPRSSPWWWVVGPWQRDDALWYQSIAERGYSHHGADTAFFPLYPGLSWVVAAVLRAPVPVAQLVVSSVALVVALVLVRHVVEAELGTRVAARTVLYITVAPSAFFLVAPFTEATFLALSAGMFAAAMSRRFLLAGLLAAAATLCRAQGVFLLVPLAVEIAADWRARRSAAPWWRYLLALGLPATAAAGFATLMAVTGHGGPAAAQAFWGKHVAAPWTVVGDSISTALRGAHPEELYNLLAAALLVVAIPLMARRVRASFTAYTAVSILPLLAQENGLTPLMSVARFAVVVFPAFALLALAGSRRSVHRLVTVMSPVLLFAAFFDFTRFHFIG